VLEIASEEDELVSTIAVLAVSDAEALGVVPGVWETTAEVVGLDSRVLVPTSEDDGVGMTSREDSELASGV
jgi:hypothetical protein